MSSRLNRRRIRRPRLRPILRHGALHESVSPDDRVARVSSFLFFSAAWRRILSRCQRLSYSYPLFAILELTLITATRNQLVQLLFTHFFFSLFICRSYKLWWVANFSLIVCAQFNKLRSKMEKKKVDWSFEVEMLGLIQMRCWEVGTRGFNKNPSTLGLWLPWLRILWWRTWFFDSCR